MGCRTDYRAYAADEVSAIVPTDIDVQYGVRQEAIAWQPPFGFALGNKLPPADRIFTPVPFRDGTEKITLYFSYAMCH
jgi:hypothetical protein